LFSGAKIVYFVIQSKLFIINLLILYIICIFAT